MHPIKLNTRDEMKLTKHLNRMLLENRAVV